MREWMRTLMEQHFEAVREWRNIMEHFETTELVCLVHLYCTDHDEGTQGSQNSC